MPYKDPAKEREKKRRWFAKKYAASAAFRAQDIQRRKALASTEEGRKAQLEAVRKCRRSAYREYVMFDLDTRVLEGESLTQRLKTLAIPHVVRIWRNQMTVSFAKRWRKKLHGQSLDP